MPEDNEDAARRRRVPVLLDTDPGNDIDDACCLAYLLRQPRCELLGVTTVTGDTRKRAQIADALCRAAGRPDVPVFAGLTGPLLHGRGQPEVPHYEAIKDDPGLRAFDSAPPGDAVAFLRDTIRARPGEITLLAIGPMTNVAALFAADPEIPALLDRIVLMCGVFTGRNGHGPGVREWNALCDPIAAALVYEQAARSAPGKLLSVGLEVTTKCRLPAAECRDRFSAGEPLQTVLRMAEVWFAKQADKITFHDPLAAALIFEPGLCETGPGRCDVAIDDGPFAGLTRWSPSDDPAKSPHRVAYTVDSERFFEHYFAVTAGAGG